MNKEKKIQKLIEQRRNLQEQIYILRESLIEEKSCTHAFISDYRWTFDNGYGIMKKKTGKRCNSCLFVDPYNQGTWTNPLDYL
jgi:hypothetical protein